MSDSIVFATDDSFKRQVLECEEAVAVAFWAPWRRPCVNFVSMFEEAAEAR